MMSREGPWSSAFDFYLLRLRIRVTRWEIRPDHPWCTLSSADCGVDSWLDPNH
jgi:hypothetical protein